MSTHKIIERWGIIWSDDLRYKIGRGIADPPSGAASIVDGYLEGVDKYASWMREDIDVLANGVLYYYANIIYGLCNYLELEKVHGDKTLSFIFSISMQVGILAVVTDDIIDSYPEKIDDLTKVVKSILEGNPIRMRDERLKTVHSLLLRIVKSTPSVVTYIDKAFQAEITSLKQSRNNAEYQERHDEIERIEHSKGMLSFEFLNSCLSRTDVDISVPPDLGYLIQIYDDIMDMYIDKSNDILTVVWTTIDKYGCLDKVIEQGLEILDSLPTEYWPVKVIGITSLACLCTSNVHVSGELRRILTPYLPYAYIGDESEDVPYIRSALIKILKRCI